MSPPEVVARAEAVYPAEALRRGEEATVALLVTVEADGSVSDVAVEQSAGEAFDQAARHAAAHWTFRPATRDGAPVRVRIRVPFQFVLPPLETPVPGAVKIPPSERTAAKPVAPPKMKPASPALAHPQREPAVTVEGQRPLRAEDRSASEFSIQRDILGAAPRQEGAEILRTAPGLYIGRAEGLAVGHRYALRGFDADHGQDIEFLVGGIPVNMPSHIHGQGYADLGFLIAETALELRALEGVYDPRQGDFAVAGTLDVRLGVERRGLHVKSGYGSFGTHRQSMLWAPPGLNRETFGAVQYVRTDGYGESRGGQAASAIVQSATQSGSWRYRALGILYGARAELAGVVRADDVESGRVGFYGVYPHATAERQNALSTRLLAGAFAEYRGPEGDTAALGAWVGFDNFRIQENFTGFVQRSRTLENVAGRGDLIEQQNRTKSLGLTAHYRTAPYRPAQWTNGSLELGFQGRIDDIEQAQNLLDASVRNQTWDRRVDANVLGADLGFWGDVDWRIARIIALRLGMRADALAYETQDRLGNFAPLTRPQDAYIIGFRRSATGLVWGPRTSAEVRPLQWLSIRAAYGEGYRSPQARTLEDGEDAPFSKVRSADLGVRAAFDEERYELTVAAYQTRLSDDVAFDAEEGRLERIGKTRRAGAIAHAHVRPVDWAVGAVSVTWVDAELREPPPPSAEEPQPAFRRGANLPFVPPVVVRADLGIHPIIARQLGRYDLGARVGLGFSYLSPRPLPFGDYAEPVSLLDTSAGLAWGPIELELAVYNTLDTRYSTSEFTFASHWDPNAPRTRMPARHFAAGPPRSWLLSLGVTL